MEFADLVSYLLIASPFLLGLWLLRRIDKVQKKLPPGPRPLPVIGNLLSLGHPPHKSLAKLAKIHGPIMSLQLGQITTVVISSSTLAKEVLQRQDLAFSTRTIPAAIHAHDHSSHSMVWLPVSDQWRGLRKMFNSAITGNNILNSNEYLRRKKVADLMSYVKKCCKKGEPVDVGQAAFTNSLNFLFDMIFSVDLANVSEVSSKEFRDLVSNMTVEAGAPNLADYFPVLAKIDPHCTQRRMTKLFQKMFDSFGGLIDERLESRRLTKANDGKDLLDVLLNISGASSDEIDKTHLEHLFMDLFIAGTDTISSTIEWAMAEVLCNPKILTKAKVELEGTIGKGKQIEESDVARLPYLQAIIKETMRKHPPAPFLIPRKVVTDVEIDGYIVPKGAQVLVNVWAIGRDLDLWKDPTLFKPERFLDLDIDVRGQDFELIPFGAGRRICPGLSLAMRVVPVVVGSLLNSFGWKLYGGVAPEDLDMEKFGITLQKANPLLAVPMAL